MTVFSYNFFVVLIIFYFFHIIAITNCSFKFNCNSKGSSCKENRISHVSRKLKQMSETQNENHKGKFLTSKPKYSNIYTKDPSSEINIQECGKDFLLELSKLMKTFNITLKSKFIVNLKPFMKLRTTAENKFSKLYFIIIANMKQLYSKFDGIKMIRHFQLGDIPPEMEKSLFLKGFDKYKIHRMKITIAVENFYDTGESEIQIRYEIDFKQDRVNTEAQNNSNTERKEPLQKLLKKKWERKQMKVQKFSSSSIITGSALALSSSILCGLSFALKKRSLLKMDKSKSYYLDQNWWLGHSFMMIGDGMHLIAFSFAPAIIVCTIQILTVLVTAITSSKLLGEKLHKHGKLAFALSLGGCWVIVFHVPNEPHIYSIQTLLHMILSHIFLCYVAFLSITTILLLCYWIPKYGQANSLAYTIQSAIFGSMVVIGVKGIILGYTDTIHHWLPWGSLLAVGILLLLQLEYLNKALAIYNTLVVTTQYYVLYSACVILASTLLFKLWKMSSQETIFTNFCGLATIALGALILTIFEEGNATFDFSRLFAGPEVRNKQKISKANIALYNT